MADQLANITDEELQMRLARFGHTITKGKLTDAQRQIQKKKLNHLEAKERAEKEKAEKAEKEAAKRALGSPPPKKKAKTSRRRTVATLTPESETEEETKVNEEIANKGSNSTVKMPVPVISLDKVDSTSRDDSPLVIQLIDTGLGRPAASVPVTISVYHATRGWFQLAARRTNSDGECPGLVTKDLFQGGLYRIKFDTEAYYRAADPQVHFPHVEVSLHVENPGERYNVSVLLMPYGYTCSTFKYN